MYRVDSYFGGHSVLAPGGVGFVTFVGRRPATATEAQRYCEARNAGASHADAVAEMTGGL